MKYPKLPANIYFIFFLIILLAQCRQHELKPVKIAISKAVPEKSYANYINWLHKIDSTVIIVEMYHTSIDSAIFFMNDCDGLLITGGTDVNPGKYGKAFDTIRCWPIDHKRDSLEFSLIQKAVKMKMPILGICRGEQILNVSHGGSLFVDLPEDLDTIVKHQCPDKYNCFHKLKITPESILFELTENSIGMVNSNHHQGINNLAGEFEPIAFTEDGLVEAIQWKDGENKGFLLGVQWHPERMDLENPLSGKIGERFINEVTAYQQAK